LYFNESLCFVVTILCCIILGSGMRRNRSATIRFLRLCASYREYRNLAYETIYTESMLTRHRVTYSLSRNASSSTFASGSRSSRKTHREIRAKLRLSPFLFVESGNNISLSLSLSSRIRTSTQNICTPVHASLFISY